MAIGTYKVFFKARRGSGLVDYSCTVTAKNQQQAVAFGHQEIMAMGYTVDDFFKGKAKKKVAPDFPRDNAHARKKRLSKPGAEFSIEGINKKIKKLKVGERLVLEGVPNAIYHATEGYGSTALKLFNEAPAKLAADRAGALKKDESKFLMGSAIHDAVLLPDAFATNYVIMPHDIKVRHGKRWDTFVSEHIDKSILTPDQYKTVCNTRDALMRDKGRYFTQGRAETSYWYRHESGLILKARTDYEIDDLIVDLKTTQTASPARVDRLIWDFGYYLQRCLYLMVTGLADFVFVFIEPTEPYLSYGPVWIDELSSDDAVTILNGLLDDLSDCEQRNQWHGYPTGLQISGMPAWFKHPKLL